jgi:tetratricopeptide (TPR) repeat protein
MDFGSDEKPTKRAARVMIQMVRTMNADYVSKIPEREGGRMLVTCQTCHRAAQRPPRPLEETLYETATAKGVPAALEQLRDLREQFLGSGLYDFRERTLNVVGTRLLDNKRPDDALAVLKANLESYPRSVNALFTIARIGMVRGDRSLAETYFRKVLEVDPKNEAAQQALDSLKPKQ